VESWWINGEPADCVSAADRGLSYGDGLFETMACLNGRVRHFDQHWARLSAGCEQLGIACPERALIESEIAAGVLQHPCVLKLLLTRGSGRRGYAPDKRAQPTRIMGRFSWPDFPQRCYEQGARIGLVDMRLGINPALAGLKHLNRLEQVLGARQRQEQGWDEGLMLDTTDQLIGGTMSNLFVVQDERLLTPELTGCGIRGVMRNRVLAAASGLGLAARETVLGLDDLLRADEVFLSNALIGLWPVASFADRRWTPGPITGRLGHQVTSGSPL
jgi:4-amino-4-deoxychorismate lyase